MNILMGVLVLLVFWLVSFVTVCQIFMNEMYSKQFKELYCRVKLILSSYWLVIDDPTLCKMFDLCVMIFVVQVDLLFVFVWIL